MPPLTPRGALLQGTGAASALTKAFKRPGAESAADLMKKWEREGRR